MADITCRPATEADLPQVRIINEHYVLHTCATLKRAVPKLLTVVAKWQTLQTLGLPYLVAVDSDDRVLGYTYLSPYRESYAPTTELSLFVHPTERARGVGSALLERVLDLVRERRVLHRWADGEDGEEAQIMQPTMVRTVLAVMAVDPEGKEGGEALKRFYTSNGFKECGRLVKVGLKRGHWIDVIHLQFTTWEDE